jgi:uncharacterized membrane protein YccC
MQKQSKMPTPVQLMIHFGMGAVLGALLALAMILINKDIFQSILSSSSPLMDMAFFVGVLSFAIGTGASMTGFHFTAIELDALAKRQTSRVKHRQDPRKGPLD